MLYDETFVLSSPYFVNEDCRYIADDHEDECNLYFRNISVKSYDFQVEFSYKYGLLKLVGLDGTVVKDMSDIEMIVIKECLTNLFNKLDIEVRLYNVLRKHLQVGVDRCSMKGCRSPEDEVKDRYGYPLCYGCRIHKDNEDYLKKYPYG